MTELNTKLSTPPIDLSVPQNTETATLCLGCFWSPDSEFGATKGVVRTRVGYAGGSYPDPTYHNLGDHIETIQIDYDPLVLGFENIVDIFWKSHNPSEPYWERQYTKAIFYHDEKQKKIIFGTMNNLANKTEGEITTEVIRYERFYLAENYHQKYHLQTALEILKGYKNVFNSMQEFIDSTSAARANGYIRGYGKVEDFEAEIDKLGLSEEAALKLNDVFYKYKKKAVY
jgi:methionine-S-sulfoxide reductase